MAAKLKAEFGKDPLFFLSHIDCIHDFKPFLSQDRPNQPRGGDPAKFHYWTGFKHYIMSYDKKGTEIRPSLTKIFNGCKPIVSAATIEDVALEMSTDLMGIQPVEIVYGNPNSFYDNVYAALGPYRGADGRVPLVIDVEYKLNTADKLREFVSQFAVCRNKEHYSDPSRSFMRDYGAAVVEEDGADERRYDAGDNVNTRLGTVVVSGRARDVTINYGGVLTETYVAAQKVFPNSKGQCRGAFTQLLKVGDYVNGNIDYCSGFQQDVPLPGKYATPELIARIASHLIKKRLGDQLQVASCQKRIKYRNVAGASIEYGGDLPAVFWSFDRVAIAYAILLNIPCVQEFVNGNVRIYLPRKQRGGACTRGKLDYSPAEMEAGIPTSKPIVDLVNENPECLNRYLELHFETDSIYYQPIFCVQLIKLLGLPVNPAMFEENYVTLYNDMAPQMYIEGEPEEASIIALLSANPSWVFYSLKYKLYIDHAVGAGGEHVFQICSTQANGSTPGPVLFRFNQTVLGAAAPGILLQEGGSASKKKEDPVAHFLAALSSVEKISLVLSDNRELFTAELKCYDVPPVGYTCYDIIFFVRALVKKFKGAQKPLVSESVGALFDILKELGENTLLDNLKLFLNTYSQYRHISTKNYGAQHIKFIKSLLEKSKERTREIEKTLAGFKYDLDKMVRYLDKHLPLGTLTKLYNQTTSGKSARRMVSSSAKFLSSMSKMPSLRRSTSKVASTRRSTSKVASGRRSTSKVPSSRRSTSKLVSGSKLSSTRSRRVRSTSRFRPQLSVLAE